jgi:hypothetical protein
MNYILAILNEIRLETQYRLWASQVNNLESYETFGEFLRDAKWYSREMVDGIKDSAKFDY